MKLVTGATGLVGAAFVNLTKMDGGYTYINSGYDLRNIEECQDVFESCKPDSVIHLAGKVGGVRSNHDKVYDYYLDNIRINTNIIDQCVQNKAAFLGISSVCVYPHDHRDKLKEEMINDGEPHFTNFGYAYAKRMMLVQCRAAARQYGLTFSCLCPNNLFGPNDNFDLENCHVIPALIRKIYEGKYFGRKVSLYGNGKQMRQFTYSYDLAEFIIEFEIGSHELLNVGCPDLYSISDIATRICKIFDYPFYKVEWTGEHEGQDSRRLYFGKWFSDINTKTYSWTKFQTALEDTCEWFKENYPNVRGIA